MKESKPRLVILAGPNGAGKSTAARYLLRGALGVDEYVNADAIAQGLSGFQPERAALQAGRVTLQRLKQLAAERADFAFETTLASRSFAPWIAGLISERGYRFGLAFLWLPSPEFAVRRVAARVRLGGHGIPEEVIRRRYDAGLRNLFTLYLPIARRWRVYDSSIGPIPRLIAGGTFQRTKTVVDARLWERIQNAHQAPPQDASEAETADD